MRGRAVDRWLAALDGMEQELADAERGTRLGLEWR